MTLEKQDGRWIAKARYGDWSAKEAGFKWDHAKKVWWTSDPSKAYRVRKAATEAIATELERLVSHQIKTQETSLALSRATDADIYIPSPEGLCYLPFQRAGIAYALSREATLIGDEMGLGKTIQAIGVINASPEAERILVICPASLRLNWKQELEKWMVTPKSVGIAQGNTFPDVDVCVINYDILHKHSDALRDQTWDLMVVDEVHYLKNPKARRTKQVFGGYETSPIQSSRRLFLTGTPMVNRPVELYPILRSIDRDEWGNWKAFVLRYCDAFETKYGWDVSGSSHLGELQERLRSTCMVRRLKTDVLKDLPPKRRQIIELPADGMRDTVRLEQTVKEEWEDKVAHLKVQVELSKASESRQEYENSVNNLQDAHKIAFTEMAKARHAVALAKVPAVVNRLADVLDADEKVVVFAHHHDVIDTIMDQIPDGMGVKLDGRDSMKKRDTAVKTFQDDHRIRVFVGGIKAAGVGLTLTSSSHVIFAELDWVPGVLSQAEDRCHRLGQVKPVLIQHLVVEGSIDALMAHTIVKKQEVLDLALDEMGSSLDEYQTVRDLDEIVTLDDTSEDDSPDTSTEPLSYDAITEEAKSLTDSEINHYHKGVQIIAQACDGAAVKDRIGFNRIDTMIGVSLAGQSRLTPRQGVIAKKLCRRYRRQLESMGYSSQPKQDSSKASDSIYLGYK